MELFQRSYSERYEMLIAQLSDLHVRPEGLFYEDVADSNDLLYRAIDHLHSLDRRPDLVVLTGDIVDSGSLVEYANALKILSRLTIPYLVLPGNHDNRENFRKTFLSHTYLPTSGPMHFCVDDHPVRVVGLDTTVISKHHGEIGDSGAKWLRTTLTEDREKPTLVFMHHPPFVSGIPYLDEYRCVDSASIGNVLKDFSNIEAVLCGHVHRLMVRRWAGTVVIASPSTATEIALQLDPGANPQSFLGPCACMLHLWRPEEGLVSHLSHINEFEGPYPFF